MKKGYIVFLILVLCIISCGIGVYGANVYPYKANEISYNPSNGETMNVNDALNELYNNSLKQEITGDWNMRVYIDINPYNSSTLSSSYIQVYLQKGIFETIAYNHNFTNTFSQTTTVAFSDFSSVFTNLKFKIVEHIPGHNSGNFMNGDAYINVYLIYNDEEILVFETTTSTTSHEKNEIISITEYIS